MGTLPLISCPELVRGFHMAKRAQEHGDHACTGHHTESATTNFVPEDEKTLSLSDSLTGSWVNDCVGFGVRRGTLFPGGVCSARNWMSDVLRVALSILLSCLFWIHRLSRVIEDLVDLPGVPLP